MTRRRVMTRRFARTRARFLFGHLSRARCLRALLRWRWRRCTTGASARNSAWSRTCRCFLHVTCFHSRNISALLLGASQSSRGRRLNLNSLNDLLTSVRIITNASHHRWLLLKRALVVALCSTFLLALLTTFLALCFGLFALLKHLLDPLLQEPARVRVELERRESSAIGQRLLVRIQALEQRWALRTLAQLNKRGRASLRRQDLAVLLRLGDELKTGSGAHLMRCGFSVAEERIGFGEEIHNAADTRVDLADSSLNLVRVLDDRREDRVGVLRECGELVHHPDQACFGGGVENFSCVFDACEIKWCSSAWHRTKDERHFLRVSFFAFALRGVVRVTLSSGLVWKSEL